MQKYIKTYLKWLGDEFFVCEICGRKAVDVHHIIARSKFGTKRKDERDNINNLIGVCRECHTAIHSGKIPLEVVIKSKNKHETQTS
jgi:5-methylcytosine-specific restriction endonuclease McrA